MEDQKDMPGQVATQAAAGSSLMSADITTITHINGETETIFYEAGNDGEYIIAEGDGAGGNVTVNGVTYEISLKGGDRNDTFVAEGGNIIASGEGGDDTYIWKSGNFLIDQEGVTDTTAYLFVDNANVTLSDFLFYPVNLGLGEPGLNDILAIVSTGEQITFTDQYMNFNGQTTVNKQVIFQINDGPEIVFENFDEWVVTYGTDDVVTGQTVFSDGGNDIVTGTVGDDILAGGAGDDILYGLTGSDYVDGGRGDDLLVMTYEGSGASNYYIGASGTDTLRIMMTQEEFDTAEVRNELVALQNFIAENRDPNTQNGPAFESEILGLTAVDFEILEVYADEQLMAEITPIDIAPELSGTTSVVASLSEISIEYLLDPTPQDFPELVEGQRLKPHSLINGAHRENLSFENAHEVKVNFVTEGAGYKNTLGMYTVEADGTISNVMFLEENASGTGSGVFGGGSLNAGDLLGDLGLLTAGTEIGFFIVADGYNKNGQYNNFDQDSGSLQFRNNGSGDNANLNDHYADTGLVFVNQDGSIQQINGHVYHASSSNLNADGEVHAVSGVNENGNLSIGFEDLYNLGDADFEDLVIEIEVGDASGTALNSFAIAADFTIVDGDDNTITEMVVDLSDGGQAGDTLSVDASLLDGTNISMNSADGTNLVFSGSDTAEAYQAILQSLTFGSSAENPSAGLRSVEVSVTDDDGLTDSAVIDVNIEAAGLDMMDVLADTDPLAMMLGGEEDGNTSNQMTPVEFDMGLNADEMTAAQGSEFM